MRTDFPLILALWGAGLGAAGQYAKISVIFDQLGGVYPDAGAALGFVVSLVGVVGIVFGVVAGLLVARIGYRRSLLWALWAGAAISAVQALILPLPWLLVSRAVEGASHLMIVVAAPTLIAQLSTERHRGLTLTLWSSFFAVSFTLLVFLGLPLVAAWGLPSLFWAHAAWMAGFAVLLSLRLRPLDGPRPPPVTIAGMLRDHVAIYTSPTRAAPAAGWLFYTFCFVALLTVLPPFIAAEDRAWVLGTMPLISIGVSMTLGVWLLRKISAVALTVAGFGITVLCLAWLWAVPGGPVACLVLAGGFGLIQGASFAAVPQLNASVQARAQANGAMAQMGNLGNTTGTPVILAVIAVAGYGGMIGAAILALIGGISVHLWMARRRQGA